MKLIKPSYKILNQSPGLQGIYEQIELAGRTCYASTHKIQYQENDTCNGSVSTTAKDFVDRMIASKHYAMLEHGTVYLKIRKGTYAYSHYVVVCEPDDDFMSSSRELSYRPYTKVNIQDDYIYVTTNYRVLVENGWLDDLKYLCEPTEYHEKRVTVRFTTGVDISREFNRHRVNSMAEQSTRYCNFSKDKFNSEITCIIPHAYLESNAMGGMDTEDIDVFCEALKQSEKAYFKLLELGWKPENARKVLPLDLATELVHTAFVSDWNHFFDLRSRETTGKAHPDAKALAEPLMNEFIKRGYIEE